jgi:hypothetical protein
MSDMFDGTKSVTDGPSLRAGVIMIVLLLVVVAGLLLFASGALNGPGAEQINTNPNPALLESAPPES